MAGAFGLAVTSQINFLVPLRARELGATMELVGLMVGAGAAAPALFSVTSGVAIDRLGARQTFVLGAAATAALALLCVFVTNYWWFLALQPVLGVARNLGWLASQAYITGLGTEQQRPALAGRFAFFTNAGQMVAPAMIGIVAQLTGFRWAFLFLAAYSVIFAIVGLLMPSGVKRDAVATGHSGFGYKSAVQLLARPAMQVVLLLSGARLWIMWIFTAFLPIYLIEHGLAAGVVGIVMATSGVVATLITPTTGFWTRFLNPPSVAVIGLGCGVAGLLVAPHVPAIPLVYLVPALVGIGHGLSLPILIAAVAQAAPPDRRGVAFGLRATVNQTAAAGGPVVVGLLIAASGMLLGFTIGALIGGGMLAGAAFLHRAAQRAQPTTPET